jgi:hypothetical protein
MDDSWVVNPKAPRLKDPRFAGRLVPAGIAAQGKRHRCQWYFATPSGAFLSFKKTKGQEGIPVLIDEHGVRVYKTPALTFPWPHGFSPDGRWLALGTTRGAVVLGLASGETRELPSVGRSDAVSLVVADHVVAYASTKTQATSCSWS